MLIVKNDNTGVAAAIEELERTYNIKLPDVYRRFLLKYNGGETLKTSVKESGKRTKEEIRCFYSINGEDNSFVQLSETGSLEEYLDRDLLPIAEDDYGNSFLLNLAKNSYGEVMFYDHEKQKTKAFSKSFTEFVSNAKSEIFRVSSIEERVARRLARGEEVTDELIEIWQEEIDSLKGIGEQEEVILD